MVGLLKNVFGAAKKQREMIPEEYRGIAGRVRRRERAAADTNASLDLAKGMQEVAAEQQRLLSVGLLGEATVIAIQENVALAWVLANPAVTAPIVGPRTIEQLDGSLRALEVTLDEETMGKLDEIFPGPGGPAPEAYAW